MKKEQIIKTVLFMSLVIGMLPYLPKKEVSIIETECPVNSMIVINSQKLIPEEDKIIIDGINGTVNAPTLTESGLSEVYNTFFGVQAGVKQETTGNYNVAIGYRSGSNNTIIGADSEMNENGWKTVAINRDINRTLSRPNTAGKFKHRSN